MKKTGNSSGSIQLDRVAFYGRTLSEYLRMFDINLESWKGCRVLDCPSGASSFVAEANGLEFMLRDATRCSIMI